MQFNPDYYYCNSLYSASLDPVSDPASPNHSSHSITEGQEDECFEEFPLPVTYEEINTSLFNYRSAEDMAAQVHALSGPILSEESYSTTSNQQFLTQTLWDWINTSNVFASTFECQEYIRSLTASLTPEETLQGFTDAISQGLIQELLTYQNGNFFRFSLTQEGDIHPQSLSASLYNRLQCALYLINFLKEYSQRLNLSGCLTEAWGQEILLLIWNSQLRQAGMPLLFQFLTEQAAELRGQHKNDYAQLLPQVSEPTVHRVEAFCQFVENFCHACQDQLIVYSLSKDDATVITSSSKEPISTLSFFEAWFPNSFSNVNYLPFQNIHDRLDLERCETFSRFQINETDLTLIINKSRVSKFNPMLSVIETNYEILMEKLHVLLENYDWARCSPPTSVVLTYVACWVHTFKVHYPELLGDRYLESISLKVQLIKNPFFKKAVEEMSRYVFNLKHLFTYQPSTTTRVEAQSGYTSVMGSVPNTSTSISNSNVNARVIQTNRFNSEQPQAEKKQVKRRAVVKDFILLNPAKMAEKYKEEELRRSLNKSAYRVLAKK